MLLIFSVALVVALVSSRSLSGSVPGEDPVLSLGVVDKGFVVGTTKGMWVSSDARVWHRSARFHRDRTLAASVNGKIFTVSRGVVEETSDLETFEPAVGAVLASVAIATDPKGDVFLSNGSQVTLSTPDSGLQSVPIVRGPKEVIALAAAPGATVTVYAGGLSSGMWRSIDGGLRWRRMLETPTRALMVDPADPKRVFLGTAGGLLVSTNRGVGWKFTDMRLKVEAIAAEGADYYVLTDDRLIYRSKNGIKDWKLAGRD
jgi:hypothetical protein